MVADKLPDLFFVNLADHDVFQRTDKDPCQVGDRFAPQRLVGNSGERFTDELN